VVKVVNLLQDFVAIQSIRRNGASRSCMERHSYRWTIRWSV